MFQGALNILFSGGLIIVHDPDHFVHGHARDHRDASLAAQVLCWLCDILDFFHALSSILLQTEIYSKAIRIPTTPYCCCISFG